MGSLIMAMLGAALAGGLLVLNGFAKSKEASEAVLDVYQEMLANAKPMPKADMADRADKAEE